jgi:hypothetical protein
MEADERKQVDAGCLSRTENACRDVSASIGE